MATLTIGFALQHFFSDWECLGLFGDLALKFCILSIERNIFVAHLCGRVLELRHARILQLVQATLLRIRYSLLNKILSAHNNHPSNKCMSGCTLRLRHNSEGRDEQQRSKRRIASESRGARPHVTLETGIVQATHKAIHMRALTGRSLTATFPTRSCAVMTETSPIWEINDCIKRIVLIDMLYMTLY